MHKDLIVACRWVVANGEIDKETRSFGAKTHELQALAAWSRREGDRRDRDGVDQGVLGPGVERARRGGFKLCLVNPAHFKNVPGRKSDVKDAEWLAKLMSNGLLRAELHPILQGTTSCEKSGGARTVEVQFHCLPRYVVR